MKEQLLKIYLGILLYIQKFRTEPIVIKGKDFEMVIPGRDRGVAVLPDSWKDWEY